MPLKAIQDGNEVLPDEVYRSDYATCPECGDDMGVVKQHRRDGSLVVRHFRHRVESGCPGGESDIHVMMKYVVKSKLKTTFDDADVGTEVSFYNINRRADVAAKFQQPLPRLGNGVVVEAQHRNEDKEKLATTLDFLSEGLTVIWVDETDFKNNFHSVEFSDINFPFSYSLPHPDEWCSSFHQEFVRDLRAETYPIQATLPDEYQQEISGDLERAWRIGSNDLDVDIERKLSENNARRACVECGKAADWYIADFGVLSGFFCSDHHPGLE